MRATYSIGYNSSDGVSLEIYLSGCNREQKCPDCHNPKLWDFNYGEEINYENLKKLIDDNVKNFDNFVILGGEPLDQNVFELVRLLRFLKFEYTHPIWLYTSYEYEEMGKYICRHVDYIKTGMYIKELHTENNIILGVKLASSNQTIWEVVHTEEEER